MLPTRRRQPILGRRVTGGRRCARPRRLRAQALPSPGEPKEHENRAAEPNHVVVSQPADPITELGSRHGRDLVDHQSGGLTEPVRTIGFDQQPKQWRVGRVGRECANGHRVGSIEAIVLDDDDRSRLADIPAPCGSSPDLASIQASSSKLSASMKAWSSAARSLAATAADWRRASRSNSADRTSGTQICTGRSPWARSRRRCSRTRALTSAGSEEAAIGQCYM